MKIEPFRLERYFAIYEFTAKYLLSSSDCEALPVGELLGYEPGAREEFDRLWLGYTESLGNPVLRQEITTLYRGLNSSEVLVHNGAEEAIFLFANAMLEAGDHVVVHWPCYQSLYEVPYAIGCEVTRWAGKPEAGWRLDLDDLRRSLKPNTRAVFVNFPHNPTGFQMSQEDWLELNRLADRHGFILFSDEVYRFLEQDPATRLPAACDLSPRAVTLNVMSKAFGLAGLRIGWIATHHREVYDRMASLKDYTTICSSAPSEFLGTVALRQREKVVGRNLEIIRRNMALLDDFFARRCEMFDWARPQAGSIAFPRLLTTEDAAGFARRTVEQAGVLLVPGDLYDPVYRQHFRLGFGRANLPEALATLDELIDREVQ